MQANVELCQGLRRLLGETVDYRGHPMVKVRRVQRTLTIQALDASGEHLSAVLEEALSAEQMRRLSEMGSGSSDD